MFQIILHSISPVYLIASSTPVYNTRVLVLKFMANFYVKHIFIMIIVGCFICCTRFAHRHKYVHRRKEKRDEPSRREKHLKSKAVFINIKFIKPSSSFGAREIFNVEMDQPKEPWKLHHFYFPAEQKRKERNSIDDYRALISFHLNDSVC